MLICVSKSFKLQSEGALPVSKSLQDDVFEAKEEIAQTIKSELTKSMSGDREEGAVSEGEAEGEVYGPMGIGWSLLQSSYCTHVHHTFKELYEGIMVKQ